MNYSIDWDGPGERDHDDADQEIKRLEAELIEAEKYNGWHQIACLEIERLRAITPDMVDRALKAWFSSPPSETDQGLEHSMRAALEAAHANTEPK